MAVDFNCRFTDRTLTMDVHGSGIKLTISKPDLDERGREVAIKTSLFLDARDIGTLTDVLVGLGFGTTKPTSAPPRDRQAVHLESVLYDLEHAITQARHRLLPDCA